MRYANALRSSGQLQAAYPNAKVSRVYDGVYGYTLVLATATRTEVIRTSADLRAALWRAPKAVK